MAYLSKRDIAKLAKNPGRHGIGDGLYLLVKQSGRASFVYRFQLNGKRTDYGLGGYDPAQDKAEYIDKVLAKHRDARAKVLDGISPKEDKITTSSGLPTFKQAAEDYIRWKSIPPKDPTAPNKQFTNSKHIAQWRSTLKTYVYDFVGDKPVDEINTNDIRNILEPIWYEIPETARRVKDRVFKILGRAYTIAERYDLAAANPARWDNHLEYVLESNKSEPKHHHSLPYNQVPDFMASLREREALSAKAQRFLILTAARVSEVTDMEWSEVSIKDRVWSVPPGRMKMKKEHRVPLCPEAIEILESLPRISNLVFDNGGRALSDMSFAQLRKRMGVKTTSHGFRSSFRTWASEETDTPNHVCEQALAHKISSSVEAAYRRGDLFQHRVELMDAWGEYLSKSV